MISERRHTHLPSGCGGIVCRSGIRPSPKERIRRAVKRPAGITRIDETILDIEAARTSHGYSRARASRLLAPVVSEGLPETPSPDCVTAVTPVDADGARQSGDQAKTQPGENERCLSCSGFSSETQGSS
jgi:hypothetical protein